MGSGSSKEENTQKKPVANVNKPSNVNNNLSNSQDERKPVEPAHHSPSKQVVGTGKKSPVSESRNVSVVNTTKSDWKIGVGAESDDEDDLDEVLRIPTKPTIDRKAPQPSQQPATQTTDYPETYAQRKQREQYTLNQQLLLRQKTIYRNTNDWQNEDEDDHTGGFDASKFRKANQGVQQHTKNAIFTTKPDVETSYSHDQGELDEMDIRPTQNTKSSELPVYNASEQDLMASLEREIL